MQPSAYACSPLALFAARSALVYAVACVVYTITTRGLGTPFGDTLSAEQRRVKARSAEVRGMHFLFGLGLGTTVVSVWRPFKRIT